MAGPPHRKRTSPPRAGAAARPADAGVAGLRLTHPDKLLYPEPGITKRDLAEYYLAVADWMLPHLRGRPLTLLRCPDGQAGDCFYQKHPGEGAPAALARIAVDEKEGRTQYFLAEDVEGLVALVQMGALELHVWGSTRQALERPDRMIFDLDPDEGLAWPRVVAAALAVRDLLAELELVSFVKSTGGKGLHVVVPLAPHHDWATIKGCARGVAEELVRRAPAAFTATLSKTARRGRIFIDYLRNQRGATAVAPYSPRARPTAPVATPLTWAEVEKGTRPDRFTVATLPARLRKLRHAPWQEMPALAQPLPQAALRRLGTMGG